MKRPTSRLALRLSLSSAALAAALCAPTVLAGSDIMKCVDSRGHVTLTDQPCAPDARATRLAAASALNVPPDASADSAPDDAMPSGLVVQRYVASPAIEGQHDWRPRVPKRVRPLARDVATLKEARAQLLLIDADRQARPRLATLD